MTTTETTVNKRIDLLIQHLTRGKQRQFAEKTNVIPGTLNSIIGTRQSTPSAEILEKIAVAYPQINSEWLLKGQGEMFKDALAIQPKEEGKFGNQVIARIEAENLYLKNLVSELIQTNRNLSDILSNMLSRKMTCQLNSKQK